MTSERDGPDSEGAFRSSAPHDPGQIGYTIVAVSREMREAGIGVLREMPFTANLAELVARVYVAMEYERLESLNKLGLVPSRMWWK